MGYCSLILSLFWPRMDEKRAKENQAVRTVGQVGRIPFQDRQKKRPDSLARLGSAEAVG